MLRNTQDEKPRKEFDECEGSKNATLPFIMQPVVPKRGYAKKKMFDDFKSCFERADA